MLKRKAEPAPIEVGDVAKLKLEAGDTLLVQLKEPVTLDVAERIRETFGDIEPGARVIFLEPEIGITVVKGVGCVNGELGRQALAAAGTIGLAGRL